MKNQCLGCGALSADGTYHHNKDCLAWEAAVGPYSSPNPPPKQPVYGRAAKEGWTCPNCGAGIAPWMPYCSFCKPKDEEE